MVSQLTKHMTFARYINEGCVHNKAHWNLNGALSKYTPNCDRLLVHLTEELKLMTYDDLEIAL